MFFFFININCSSRTSFYIFFTHKSFFLFSVFFCSDNWLWTHAIMKTERSPINGVVEMAQPGYIIPFGVVLDSSIGGEDRNPYFPINRDWWKRKSGLGKVGNISDYYSEACAFTFARFQFPKQIVCNTTSVVTGSTIRKTIVLSVQTGRDGALAFILTSGLIAKLLVTCLGYCLACNAKKYETTDPRTFLFFININCSSCHVFLYIFLLIEDFFCFLFLFSFFVFFLFFLSLFSVFFCFLFSFVFCFLLQAKI